MTQYNTVNVKLSNAQLSKLKSRIRYGAEVTFNLSSNVIGNSTNETNFPHRLLLTNTEVSKLRETFANYLWANVKLSKTQLHKRGQSWLFLGRLIGSLLRNGLPLLKNVLQPLAKSVLMPVGLTAAAASTTDVVIQKKFGSGMTIFITSNE